MLIIGSYFLPGSDILIHNYYILEVLSAYGIRHYKTMLHCQSGCLTTYWDGQTRPTFVTDLGQCTIIPFRFNHWGWQHRYMLLGILESRKKTQELLINWMLHMWTAADCSTQIQISYFYKMYIQNHDEIWCNVPSFLKVSGKTHFSTSLLSWLIVKLDTSTAYLYSRLWKTSCLPIWDAW